MSVAQYIRVDPEEPFADASAHASDRCNSRPWRRLLMLCVLTIACGPLALAASSQDTGESGASSTAPQAAVSATNLPLDFTLPVATGGHWRLAEHRGQVVWLALVAPWCGQCAGFVDDVTTRLAGADLRAQAVAGADASVFMVVSAVDAHGQGLDVQFNAQRPGTDAPSVGDGKPVGSPNDWQERTQLLLDQDGAVLRTFDPDELPWLVRIDEDGVLVAAGTDLNVLAPARLEPGLWQNLRSRWRQLWGDEE